MNVLFIQTGGTIDKDYPSNKVSYAFEIADPAVRRILEIARPAFEYRVIELLKKDSIDITDQDRQVIYQTCKNANEKHIIITHGTDTMTNTAKIISGIVDKTIIITGAMRPERFSDSDAGFNVGTAVGAMSSLKPGVYIAMSGQVLAWDKVNKNYDQAKFIEI